MLSFFRENKSVRDAVIGTVATLFCIGAVFGGVKTRALLNVGKRQIDYHQIQTRYQEVLRHNPDIDKKMLEKELTQLALSSLKQFEYIENMGLIPSANNVKKALTQILPKGKTVKDLALAHYQTPNQLLLTISDQIAYRQLIECIESSSIVTPEQEALHLHTILQERTYLDIDLSKGSYPDNESAYQTIYERQSPKHPKVYHYRYIDVTPSSLELPKISDSMINDYFERNREQYSDTDYEYQVTTYIPAKSSQLTYKTWPPHIQKALAEFEKKHSNLRVNTTTYKEKRSSIPKAHDVLLGLRPGEHRVINNEHTFSIISLVNKKASNTMDPNLRPQLIKDLESSQYQSLLQQKIDMLSEDAYTNPTSLDAIANKYNLSISETKSSDTTDIESLLDDPEFTEKHYVSDAVEITDQHYRFIQLIDMEPEKTKSYDEALDDIKAIYRENILYPTIVEQLENAVSEAEMQKIAKQYKLVLEKKSTKQHPNETIFKLFASRNNRHPSVLENQHWLQLQSVDYTDSQDNITPFIQKLDSQILLSTINHETQS